MLSIPHMIVVFLVVLVVFGPQKLPELARSFGKLMAEFRKASNDFKNAFEEEMRDLERQARIAELKKQVAEANAAADAADSRHESNRWPLPSLLLRPPPLLRKRPPTAIPAIFLYVTPVTDAVPRLDGESAEMEAVEAREDRRETEPETEHAAENPPSHDQQQPA